MGVLQLKSYEDLPVNEKEIYRYAGCKEPKPAEKKLLAECLTEAKNVFSYRVVYAEFPVAVLENTVCFPFRTITSRNLAKNMAGCEHCFFMAATVGVGIDRLINRYSRISPAKALFLQAFGAERIESLCDAFCKDLSEENGVYLRPRFSPGYGDLDLAFQRDVFRALDCSRKIGLTLNESLLMSPSKSVTAIIGIADRVCDTQQKCNHCDKKDCLFRKVQK